MGWPIWGQGSKKTLFSFPLPLTSLQRRVPSPSAARFFPPTAAAPCSDRGLLISDGVVRATSFAARWFGYAVRRELDGAVAASILFFFFVGCPCKKTSTVTVAKPPNAWLYLFRNRLNTSFVIDSFYTFVFGQVY